jgi:diguanylate cyclase (GGDEF)-like protein
MSAASPLRQTSRLALAAGLGVAVLCLLYLQILEGKRSADRRIGVFLEQGNGGIVITEAIADMPAANAGLETGDLLVDIAGTPTLKRSDYDLCAERFERGRPVPFAVLRDGQPLTLPVTPGVTYPWDQFLVAVGAVLAHLGLGLLVLFQRSGDLRARLLLVLTSAVAMELALPGRVVGEPLLLALTVAAVHFLNGLEIGVELHLASLIPTRHPWVVRHRLLVPAYYALGFLLGGTAGVTVLVEELAGRQVFPWTTARAQELLDSVGLPIWALAVVLLLGTQAARHPEAEGRHQAGLVLLGSMPWVLWVWLSTTFSLFDHQLPQWVDRYFPLLLICYPVATFVAIFRYHLFDLELVVRRSLVYTALTSTLILVFYSALGAGGAMFSQLVGGTGRQSVWVISAATLLLGLLFSPLRRFLQGLIDRRFFPERQALRQQLTALAGELAVLGKLPIMGKHLVTRLGHIFGVRAATLLLADPKTGLLVTLASSEVDFNKNFDQSFLLSPHDPGVAHLRHTKRPLLAAQLSSRSPSFRQRLMALRAELAVPLMGPNELVGVLLLGRKETGQDYRAEEIELLELLSHHVATVFENARLFESATYESLTGLLRREAILEQLERELQRALRYRRPLTIGMADLDHFKEINDQFGHLAGDALLKRVAQVLQSELRGTDAIGRYGGEEFLLVLPETDIDSATRVAEKVRHAIERAGLTMDDGTVVHATVSIGLGSLAEVGEAEQPTVRDLIAIADRSLYQAKKGGRNRVEPAAA